MLRGAFYGAFALRISYVTIIPKAGNVCLTWDFLRRKSEQTNLLVYHICFFCRHCDGDEGGIGDGDVNSGNKTQGVT